MSSEPLAPPPGLRPRAYRLTVIARTGERFHEFAPYVPAVDECGRVAFHALLSGGASRVLAGDEAELATLADASSLGFVEIISHPAINRTGHVCFYARRADGRSAVVLGHAGGASPVFENAGPLGPTINTDGAIAFRGSRAVSAKPAPVAPSNAPAPGDARAEPGICVEPTGVYLRNVDGTVRELAHVDRKFAGFAGIPAISSRGSVVLCAELWGDRRGIYRFDGATLRTVVETGDDFLALGAFPTVSSGGVIAFSGVKRDGCAGVFAAWPEGRIETLLDARAAFESFRGVHVDAVGAATFWATPRGGALGVFCGPDPRAHRVLGIGDALLGATVKAFALNAASVNAAGTLALRVGLSSGGQAIVRADPEGA